MSSTCATSSLVSNKVIRREGYPAALLDGHGFEEVFDVERLRDVTIERNSQMDRLDPTPRS